MSKKLLMAFEAAGGEAEESPNEEIQSEEPNESMEPEGDNEVAGELEAGAPVGDTSVDGEPPVDPATIEVKLPDLENLEVDKAIEEVRERQEDAQEATEEALGEGESLNRAMEQLRLATTAAGEQGLSQEHLSEFASILEDSREFMGFAGGWRMAMERKSGPLTSELVMEGFVDTLLKIWEAIKGFFRRAMDAAEVMIHSFLQGLDRELERTRQFTKALKQLREKEETGNPLLANLALQNVDQYVSLPIASVFLKIGEGQPPEQGTNNYLSEFKRVATVMETVDHIVKFFDSKWEDKFLAAMQDVLTKADGGKALIQVFNPKALTVPEAKKMERPFAGQEFTERPKSRSVEFYGFEQLLGNITVGQWTNQRFASGQDPVTQLERYQEWKVDEYQLAANAGASLRRLSQNEVDAISQVVVNLGMRMKKINGLKPQIKAFKAKINGYQLDFKKEQGGLGPDQIRLVNLASGCMSVLGNNIVLLLGQYMKLGTNLHRAYNSYLLALYQRDLQVAKEKGPSEDALLNKASHTL